MIIVIAADALNTAVEQCCNATSESFHPVIKSAKDVAAGAVLVSAIGAVLIGISVFAPHFSVLGFSIPQCAERQQPRLRGHRLGEGLFLPISECKPTVSYRPMLLINSAFDRSGRSRTERVSPVGRPSSHGGLRHGDDLSHFAEVLDCGCEVELVAGAIGSAYPSVLTFAFGARTANGSAIQAQFVSLQPPRP